MRSLVGNRLPKFSDEESRVVKGSIDFLGVNYYSARFAEDAITHSSSFEFSYSTDNHVNLTTEKDGIPIGEPTEIKWLYIYPVGIEELALYIKRKYKNPPMYITENGIVDSNSSSLLKDALNDSLRIKYHHNHLSYLLNAIEAGADVRGYYAWSFLDNFEWEYGYTIRFGITYIDYKNKLQRYLKKSALWFKEFLQEDYVITRNPSLVSSV
ncbi:Glycoside hydrolase [Trema orientale]|uniref:Glycoside hydrolase n=1 Tax=Trema orientale TaxID=63057 RepID=A0A2P5FQK4_TREOI|nr:Glycoside hydrolase [Trema orientale]